MRVFRKKYLPLLPLGLVMLSRCMQNVPIDSGTAIRSAVADSCTITASTGAGYWYGFDSCQTNTALKTALQKKIRNHTVLRYTESAASFPAYFTKNFISLGNISYSIPLPRFDVFDAYVVFATKGVNPYKSGLNCPSGKLLDWYDYQCYDTPSEIMSVSSGGQQAPGGGDPGLAAAVTLFGNTGVYNREHSWPKDWFAPGATPVNNPANGSYCYNGNNDSTWDSAQNWDYRAYTDLHHLTPARQAVNQQRGTCSFGIVQTADTNFPRLSGAKFGSPNTAAMPGYSWTSIPGCTSDKVFEPPAEVKGDIARNYFYMATRYFTEDTCWQTNYAVTKANLKPWLENLMRQWHADDPVSDEERQRNDWIHRIQGNRNPFVDYPEWVNKIDDF